MQNAHTKRRGSTTTSKSRTRSKSTEGNWIKLTRVGICPFAPCPLNPDMVIDGAVAVAKTWIELNRQ